MPSGLTLARSSPRGHAVPAPCVGVLGALVLTVLLTGVVSSTLLAQAADGAGSLTSRAAVQAGPATVVAAGVTGPEPAAAPAPPAAPAPVAASAPVAPPPTPSDAATAASRSRSAAAPPAPALPAQQAAPARPASVPAAAPAEPPAAPAPVDPLCGGDGWEQRRGEAALASLRRPADASPFRVTYEPGRDDIIGLATVHEGRMQVFVRSCETLSRSLLTHVVAHELGHLVDGARMDDGLRAEWLAARGIAAGTPWYGCNSCSDFATPAGDFAEVYAQWQTGAGSNRSQMAPPPSSGQLADLAARFF